MSTGPARPGGDWPGDPATARTPVAHDAADVLRLAEPRLPGPAGAARPLAQIQAASSVCRACPRLVQWREDVAATRRRAYAHETYWGRPVPSFGVDEPAVLVVGLAPGAHGANRTGRLFTGDRSGEWLYAALFRAGLANQPTAERADDGLTLLHTRIVAAVRCAPPDNSPSTVERDTCRPWLVADLRAVWPGVRAVVVLGGFAWAALWPALRAAGIELPRPRPAFGHGVEVELAGAAGGASEGRRVIGCYHVSQQNTFTGRLTAAMLDDVFARARSVAGLAP